MLNITVYEHEEIAIGKQGFTPAMRDRLLEFQAEDGRKFCVATQLGLKFQQFVGIVRTELVQIEILPKTANNGNDNLWRRALLNLLQASGLLNFDSHTDANIEISDNLFDIILWQYCHQVARLLHKGLAKRYGRHQDNTKALKGKLLLSKHISKNAINAENFYTEHTVYNKNHAANQVLLAALKLVPSLTEHEAIRSEAQRLIWHFPEMELTQKPLHLFRKIKLDRKIQHYRKCHKYAHLILSNLHPALHSGATSAFALLFDMNRVFEAYIARTLQKAKPEWQIETQVNKVLWRSGKGISIRQMPDIVIKNQGLVKALLDTKWKNMGSVSETSANDLRQVYAYNKQWESPIGLLIYPTNPNFPENLFTSGKYFDGSRCTVGFVKIINADSDKVLCLEWVGELVKEMESL